MPNGTTAYAPITGKRHKRKTTKFSGPTLRKYYYFDVPFGTTHSWFERLVKRYKGTISQFWLIQEWNNQHWGVKLKNKPGPRDGKPFDYAYSAYVLGKPKLHRLIAKELAKRKEDKNVH